jgi:hypothetical protein
MANFDGEGQVWMTPMGIRFPRRIDYFFQTRFEMASIEVGNDGPQAYEYVAPYTVS